MYLTFFAAGWVYIASADAVYEFDFVSESFASQQIPR